ncbi:MAG TPA: leucine--tRNA ligase [Gemmatimonadaceae bacterium]|jgi:leucyl-tRNA synthetase|nr:leucine--tRNA ligase [Gemmatimonadaceae bacterium]
MDNQVKANDQRLETDDYNPESVETKWQDRWRKQKTNATDIAGARDPFYALMMFPYPSAEGLHVGNLFAFVGNDIYGRFQRLQGHNVFEPFGYDAFGIHSENYALKVGQHPTKLIPANIANFERQVQRAGLMVDWDKKLATTDPDYYKWTQWVFLQLLKKGLAYKKQAAVNWCPSCKTVLANEQVIGGRCERCDTPVEQRLLEQWFFRISEYAGRLLGNLDHMDWSESTKTAQRNWIGKSEGAEIDFPVGTIAGKEEHVRVFTTRPDTIFGATYLVLAPEHPLVDRLTSQSQRAVVEEYLERTSKQDLVTRKTSTEKTGVFTGSTALNPATGKQIPVWIADYVLMEYGTGAIMAVPGHDDRDFEFAMIFGLPIVRVVCAEGDDPDLDFSSAYSGTENSFLVHSGEFDGMSVDEAKKAIVHMLAKKNLAKPTVNYRLHDWCISRQRYWGPPIPVIYCDKCGIVPVPEKDLPVELPYVEDFKPDDSGLSPLARHAEWVRVPCPSCSGMARRETDVSDTFLDSAWYFLRYPSVGRDDVPFDDATTKKWLPVDTYIGGNEHAVLHLLYSRFVTMVLNEMGYLDFEEPYNKFRAHGLIIRNGAKMSKSRGNVVIPDDYIAEWGADAFRGYLMFLGPFEEGGDFRDASISGVRRFLDRLWSSVVTAIARGEQSRADDALEVLRKLHQTIKKVGEDIPRLSYNTAIAAMMEYMNVLRRGERSPRRDEVEPVVQLVAPFAPHLAEELWERLGHSGSIFDAGWPSYDEALAQEDTIELAVQVNGKLRGRLNVSREIQKDEALSLAMADHSIAKFVTGEPKKIIFVPSRLLNIVV